MRQWRALVRIALPFNTVLPESRFFIKRHMKDGSRCWINTLEMAENIRLLIPAWLAAMEPQEILN